LSYFKSQVHWILLSLLKFKRDFLICVLTLFFHNTRVMMQIHFTCIINCTKVWLVGQLGHKRDYSRFAMYSVQFSSIQFNSIQFNSIQFNSFQFNSSQLHSFQFNQLHTFPVSLDYEVWWLFYICASVIPVVNSAGSPYSITYTHYNS
jgi:hypothetical protein